MNKFIRFNAEFGSILNTCGATLCVLLVVAPACAPGRAPCDADTYEQDGACRASATSAPDAAVQADSATRPDGAATPDSARAEISDGGTADALQEGCPAAQPVEGEACTPYPGVTWCSHGAGECTANCYCSHDGTHSGSWHCILPVAPACAPSSCPAAAPENQSACGTIQPEGPLHPASGCSYLATDCQCDCWTNGRWSCADNCSACPALPPTQDEACADSEAFASCLYGPANQCSSTTCKCHRRLAANAPLNWDCFDACASACPSAPPTSGSACQPVHHRDECQYHTAPYCGLCQCGADGRWSCSDSTCAECPVEAPINGSPCQQPNAQCDFPNFVHCECTGAFGTEWSCR